MVKGIIGKILSGSAGEVVDKVTNAVDTFVTTGAEKEELKQELIKILVDREKEIESELTARHSSDMSSDSWLSKNIRPMVLIFTIVMASIMAFTDGNLGLFQVKSAYVEMVESWGLMAFMFYFGSRGIEKGLTIAGKYRIGKK